MSRLGLDYVSPLPPVRSGIADYSTDLLPHLEPLCDLRVIRLPHQPVSPHVVERWHPVSIDELGRAGRAPLYHMGNNQHHLEVYRLAMRHPGLLTLHDLVLHHFLLGSTLGQDDFDRYRRRLGFEHGWQGEAAAMAVRWGAFGDSLQFAFPAHRRLVRRQRGVLVHSEWARSMLREECPDVEVRAIPMGIPLPERVDPARGEQFRRRHGIPLSAPLLGSFGFQTPMKRPDVAVRAMARDELREVHLVVAGELAPTLDLEEQIVDAGLSDRVHITGFLEFEEFEAAISACDLALNLRYPSAGETSAALLRVLALGRPTVVSEYAQFAELPSEAAIKIPVGEGEIEVLVRGVARLLSEPERLRAMGEAARNYVRQHHDPAAAARAMVEACAELSSLEPPPPPDDFAVPRGGAAEPTSLTWSRLPGTIEVWGHEEPWPPGERRRLRVRLTNRGPARWLAGTSGPGGVVVELILTDGAGDLLEARPTVPLPRDVGGGESAELEIALRRPLGPAHLHIEPHVVGSCADGNQGFRHLGGPRWESDI